MKNCLPLRKGKQWRACFLQFSVNELKIQSVNFLISFQVLGRGSENIFKENSVRRDYVCARNSLSRMKFLLKILPRRPFYILRVLSALNHFYFAFNFHLFLFSTRQSKERKSFDNETASQTGFDDLFKLPNDLSC